MRIAIMIIALTCGAAFGDQVLKGKHFFYYPRIPAGGQAFLRWHPLRGVWDYTKTPQPPEPQPAAADIYIRQFQVYSFGDGPPDYSPFWYGRNSSASPAWLSIQLDASDTADMIGIAYLPLGKGKYQETRYFQPYSLRLPPNRWLLIEISSPPESPYAGEFPVFDVLWTDLP